MPQKNKQKQEALTVSKLINEILIEKLNIPNRNIVNDTTFPSFTGNKRADLCISDVEYNQITKNDNEFVNNLVCYAEAKDNCIID
jgi:hypothetical protein